MDYIKLIARVTDRDPGQEAARCDNCGADGLYYCDQAALAGNTEPDVAPVKEMSRNADLPIWVCSNIRRFEDVKKLIYAGADCVVADLAGCSTDAVSEACERFGATKVGLMADTGDKKEVETLLRDAIEKTGAGQIFLRGEASDPQCARTADYLKESLHLPVCLITDRKDPDSLAAAAAMSMPDALIIDGDGESDFMEIKQLLSKRSIPVNTLTSALPFDAFKKGSDGLVPCIAQDFRTGQVLMLAYMSKESYEKTIETGRMTYYSRSRQELWTKGETSGHYQYVRSMDIDCDKDTILAKVSQIGAACHTGNRTCFFTSLMQRDTSAHNPLEVFEDVFATILDRRDHPREGSYTNYLFDKGVDKILKKVGEEATEIVIAAKNPDSDELKYEICDFLYHMMVLMAERDVTWKDITDELAQRH